MTVSDRIRSFLKNNCRISENIKEEESFLEKRYIDSTGVLDLVCYIASEFNLTIEDEDISLDNFDSIRGIEKFVLSKQGN